MELDSIFTQNLLCLRTIYSIKSYGYHIIYIMYFSNVQVDSHIYSFIHMFLLDSFWGSIKLPHAFFWNLHSNSKMFISFRSFILGVISDTFALSLTLLLCFFILQLTAQLLSYHMLKLLALNIPQSFHLN